MKFQNKGAVLVQIAPLFIQVAPLFISQPHSQNHSMVPRPHFRRKRGSNIPRVSRTKWLHLQLEKVHESATAILMAHKLCLCVYACATHFRFLVLTHQVASNLHSICDGVRRSQGARGAVRHARESASCEGGGPCVICPKVSVCTHACKHVSPPSRVRKCACTAPYNQTHCIYGCVHHLSRLWIALYAVSINLACKSLAHQARMRAIHGGAAPFPLPPPINQAPESAAATRNIPPPLPHPLIADDGGDDNGWERLVPAHRRDIVNAVVRKCELIFVCVSMSDDR